MRYLVISDSHGRNENVRRVMEEVGPVEAVFHLGDLQCELFELETITQCPVIAVAGNGDYNPELKQMRVITREGYKIVMVHGHRHGVYFDYSRLVYLGQENEAHIVMFGHTHVPNLHQEGGVILLNPGSISRPRQLNKKPTFTIMEIDKDGGIHFDMKELS